MLRLPIARTLQQAEEPVTKVAFDLRRPVVAEAVFGNLAIASRP